jgi:PAS domain S-box-containing protein
MTLLAVIAGLVATALGVYGGCSWARRRERRAREVMARASRRHELLAEHSRDIILLVRRDDGRILDGNAAAVTAYGWSAEELRGLTVFDLRAVHSPALVESQLARAASGGIRFETTHRRRDGTRFPVEVSSQGAIVDGVQVLVSVVRDVTDRRAAEEALRESEDRLALATEAAGLGIFHAVPYGPLEWSVRCREIFGVDTPTLPDFEAFLRLVHPEDREQVRAAAVRWLDPAGDGRYQDHYRCVRPDGTTRWIAASGRVRFAEEGGARRPVLLVGTISDITDQKVAQAQLMQADRLASVGMLAAGVAHEINNPLAYVCAALDFLGEHERDFVAASSAPAAVVAQALADARDGAERVRHVVRDLKTFSAAREEHRTRVSLRAVVESAIHMAANELRYRARLEREYAASPEVLADEARLGQVALNLLINAAQAIPEGRAAENEVRVAVRTDELGRAVLEVSDTGTGIPPEIADRIFDPFFTTKPRGVGTGLGLSICRAIVVALGGEIVAERRAPRGTTMRVALPAASAEVAPTPPPVVPAADRRRGRVLVVDDEPSVGAALRRALGAEHDVELRTRAADALDAIARGERFDAILCDLMMPGMSGMELHAALERLAPDQARRVIVLTGGAFTDATRTFLERVTLPRCEKPFDVPTLREVVRRVVATGGTSGAPAAPSGPPRTGAGRA